jgi:hypothetical protein
LDSHLRLSALDCAGERDRLVLGSSVGLHQTAHDIDFVLFEGIVHELQIILTSDFSADKDTNIQRNRLKIISFPINKTHKNPHNSR